MQKEKPTVTEDFRTIFNRIDYLFHVKEFENISKSKISHLKNQERFQPSDYHVQMRRLLLHMTYLYYVSYITETDFYLYPHLCINKWNVIFYYYSLKQECGKFMQKINHSEFKQNVRELFITVWNIKKDEQEEMELKAEEYQHEDKKYIQKSQLANPWREFADTFVHIFSEQHLPEITPKQIIQKLQQTKHMKDQILIVGMLSSALLPCIKFNKTVEKIFMNLYEEEPWIVGKIFKEENEISNQSSKEFMNSIVRFFKILNDFKILGITTTMSDKSSVKPQEDESLLTQFFLTLGRSSVENDPTVQGTDMMDEKNPTSNKSSEHDYSQGLQSRYFGQIKCQYYWSKRLKPRELTFRVSIFINNKVYPLYFDEIQNIWEKLTTKWKVILDEKKQLSAFNPGYIILSYNKDTYQLNFTEYVKCQPFQNALSELILTTDKLIMAVLVMKDVITFYERKSLSVQILDEELPLNEGKLQNIAKSVCQSTKNYHNYYTQLISQAQARKSL